MTIEPVKLVVGIPSRGQTHIVWSFSFSQLMWPVSMSRSTTLTVGEEVATARCNIARNAIDRGAEFLFFIDDDVTIPNYGPQRMLYLMEQNPEWDVLSAVYVTKTAPPEPLIFGENLSDGAYWNWRCGEVFEIGGCGMGCCVIRTSAFEKFPEPWFAWTDESDGINKGGEGEDLYFCRKLTEAGGTLMADGAVLCGHIDMKTGSLYRLWRDSRPFKNALPEFLADPASGQVGDSPSIKLFSEGRSAEKKKSKEKGLSGVAGS
jgi:hypothetical protein